LQVPLVRAADNADYLETPESSVAIAAAEAVAALKLAPAATVRKEIADGTPSDVSDDGTSIADSAPLRPEPFSGYERTPNSDLWLEADGLNEWSANLRDLEQDWLVEWFCSRRMNGGLFMTDAQTLCATP